MRGGGLWDKLHNFHTFFLKQPQNMRIGEIFTESGLINNFLPAHMHKVMSK